MSILGNVVGLPAPQSDWDQNDPTMADYIRNKPDVAALEEGLRSAQTQAGAALPQSGGSMTGDLNMSGSRITGLAQPQQETDAVSLSYLLGYTGQAGLALEVVLTAEDWVGEAGGPYTQTLYAAQIRETDRPHFAPAYSGARETRLAQKEAFALIDELDAENGTLIFTCFEEKPQEALTIQLEINRASEAPSGDAVTLALEEGAASSLEVEADGVTYGVTNPETLDFTVL